jgi:hypothetical protein
MSPTEGVLAWDRKSEEQAAPVMDSLHMISYRLIPDSNGSCRKISMQEPFFAC